MDYAITLCAPRAVAVRAPRSIAVARAVRAIQRVEPAVIDVAAESTHELVELEPVYSLGPRLTATGRRQALAAYAAPIEQRPWLAIA